MAITWVRQQTWTHTDRQTDGSRAAQMLADIVWDKPALMAYLLPLTCGLVWLVLLQSVPHTQITQRSSVIPLKHTAKLENRNESSAKRLQRLIFTLLPIYPPHSSTSSPFMLCILNIENKAPNCDSEEKKKLSNSEKKAELLVYFSDSAHEDATSITYYWMLPVLLLDVAHL